MSAVPVVADIGAVSLLRLKAGLRDFRQGNIRYEEVPNFFTEPPGSDEELLGYLAFTEEEWASDNFWSAVSLTRDSLSALAVIERLTGGPAKQIVVLAGYFLGTFKLRPPNRQTPSFGDLILPFDSEAAADILHYVYRPHPENFNLCLQVRKSLYGLRGQLAQVN